ncbi:MFS transporter [Phenylobacterium immobile]|uniref:MFS transporter n=1 Tax=Phenylobacterium immobile TaxID=21 RepID=UPI000A88C781|nr:MFS transporter [Phenylobacterium immobile]
MSGAEAQNPQPPEAIQDPASPQQLVGELPRSTLILLSCVSLTSGIGHSGMGSVLPAIGREIGFPDPLVSAVFSLSAFCGLIFSQVWARQADIRGRKPIIQVGILGFVLSMGACGVVVGVGLLHVLPTMTIFGMFLFARTFNGTMASASPPATQAYVAERTAPERRTQAIASLAGAAGLGTIFGPLLSPILVGTPLSLAGPMIYMSLAALCMLFAVRRFLPEDDRAKRFRENRRAGADAKVAANTRIGVGKVLADRAVRPFLLCGAVVSVCAAAMGQTIGFVMMDRIGLSPVASLPYITAAMFAGSACAVFGQWVLIPSLKFPPRKLLMLGSFIGLCGGLVMAIGGGHRAAIAGFALASLGQSLAIPAIATGASLAVSRDAQASTAGLIASMGGGAYLTAPLVVYLYGQMERAPFILTSVGMAMVCGYTVWTALKRR